MIDRRTMAQRLALLPALILPPLVPVIRMGRPGIADMWAMHRVAIEQTVLLTAIVCLAAALVGGVVTWRRETRARRNAL